MTDRFYERYVAKARIDQMRSELATKRQEIEQRRAKLDEELRALEAQEAVLADLLATSNGTATSPKPHTAPTSVRKATPATHRRSEAAPHLKIRPNPTAAVIQTLKDFGPLPQADVVDRLQHLVNPGSKTPRRALAGAIWTLLNTKRVMKDENDRLQLVTSGNGGG